MGIEAEFEENCLDADPLRENGDIGLNTGMNKLYDAFISSNCSIHSGVSYKSLRKLPPPPVADDDDSGFRKSWKHKKNPFIVSLGFTLFYSAFNTIQNLANSLYEDEGLGLYSLSLLYGFGILSCCLTPLMIKKLTPKWTLVGSFAVGFVFVCTTIYPRYYTLIPSSVILGLTQGPMWTAAIVYVTNGALDYAAAAGKSAPNLLSKFIGIFMAFQQASQVIGNLTASLVMLGLAITPPSGRVEGVLCGNCLCPPFDDNNNDLLNNRTLTHSMSNSTSITANNTVDPVTFYILSGVFITFAAVAVVIAAVFLDNRFKTHKSEMNIGSQLSITSINVSICDLLIASLKLFKCPDMLLMLPISYLCGMQLSYLFATYTRHYVTCELGVQWVGYVMTSYGCSDVVCCYGIGKLAKWLPRPVLFLTAYCMTMGLFLTMMFWEPRKDEFAVFFVIPALWGLVDAIWQTQTTAFLGILFTKNQEAAFANYRMFLTLGLAVTFAYGNSLCVSTQLYMALSICTFAILTYIVTEFKHSRFFQKILEKQRPAV